MNRLFSKLALSIVLILALNVDNILKAQISHGGTPLFYTPSSSILKSSGNSNFFMEMPPFDIDSLLKEDELNEPNMRGSFRFAHKFYVNIEKGKTGNNYVLPDGTKVWQAGIRSHGAYSINVFFSEYKIPEGGKLFLYNSNKTYVIGSFTHENNSEDNILPVQPVAGDEIIVEYQEPADAAFEAKLKISEVNHDYKDLLNSYEPGAEPTGNSYACMPDVLCQDPENDNIRSVALVIINGTTACTGTLLNTTNNDGEPVLLTAVHCLNNNFINPNVDYAKVAGTIVCFFNYNKPVCNQSQIQRMKGTENMSIAGAVPLSIAIKNDMALIRLNDKLPDYYQPYYAGWNVSPDAGNNTPFVNIHHPGGAVSKYGEAINPLSIATFSLSYFSINSQSHWKVSKWDIGSTAGGSSGSGLFDNQGLLVGGLTGGESLCSNDLPNNKSDYFFALYKSWDYTPDVGISLKNCLDPNNLDVKQCTGYDPYKDNPLVRLKNGDYNNGDEPINSKLNSPQSGLVFGHNSIYTKEFAEEFSTEKSVELVGAYLLTPVTSIATSSQIKVKAYKNALSEENLVASEIFYPTYLDYTSTESFIEKPKTMTNVATESFVKFQNEIEIGTKFYVSYEINYPSGSGRDFSVYNMIFDSPEKNTAWLCDVDGKWFPATEHPYTPMSAALAIEPLVRYKSDTSLPSSIQKKNHIIYLKASQQLQIITDNPDEKGIIDIYSVTGQLLCKMPYMGNNPVNIPPINNANIVIVKVQSESGVMACKIVL